MVATRKMFTISSSTRLMLWNIQFGRITQSSGAVNSCTPQYTIFLVRMELILKIRGWGMFPFAIFIRNRTELVEYCTRQQYFVSSVKILSVLESG